jgi:hypothetical protein
VTDELDGCPLVGPNVDGFGCPFVGITDTILVDGKEWAQVDLFINLSWNDINAACPGGICSDLSVLNNFRMKGWTWASIADMNALFNHYIGSPELGPAHDSYREPASAWAPAFFLDGWRPLYEVGSVPGAGPATYGDTFDCTDSNGAAIIWNKLDESEKDAASTWIGCTRDYAADSKGAWFYRTP